MARKLKNINGPWYVGLDCHFHCNSLRTQRNALR